ncbi:diguanylate cyclase domain-containing protein [Aquabacterium humicola]|uniref:diguanylate cyclase domain-containing protein n=1 Tax=Aquabacterium humicola TaxID=3237377 RepID=UPI002542CF77|nr:diguanylate cyclase [Rubrivivax pictus]
MTLAMEKPEAPSALQLAAWMLDESDEAALATDVRGQIVYVNKAFEALTGYERAAALGRTPSILKSGLLGRDFYGELWDTLRSGHEFHGVLVNRRQDGTLYHEEKTIRPLRDGSGAVSHYLSCGHDVSARVQAFERLSHEASHDALTGLPNRSLYLDRLEQALHRGARSGEPFAIAMIDIDRFKQVNDRFGHEAGDAVLRAVAQRLRQCLRESDTAARLGGDEFALLLPDTEDPTRVLDSIARVCAEPVAIEGAAPLDVSLSIGVGAYPRDGRDASALLRHADQAMYRVKQAGGGAVGGEAAVPPDAGDASPVALASASGPAALLLEHVPVVRRVLRAGDTIYRAGERLRGVHLVNAGMCKLVSVSPEGREELSALLFKGDWLGFDGLIDGRHACTAQAVDTGELWTMSYESLLRAGTRHPQLLEWLHVAMARQAAREREGSLAQHALNADAKVADFLCRWADGLHDCGLRNDQLTLHVSRAEIGSHVGLRLESVSRAMTRLEREQLVRFSGPCRKEIAIPRLEALREFARGQAQ